jgi:hypothetical protein
MGRPRKYATQAEKDAALRSRWVYKNLRFEPELADTIKRLAAFTDTSEAETVMSLVKFALNNRSWFTLGLWGKRSDTQVQPTSRAARQIAAREAAKRAQELADELAQQAEGDDMATKANPLTRVRVASKGRANAATPVPYRNDAKSTRKDDPAWIGYAVHRPTSPGSAYAILQTRAEAIAYAQKLADQKGIKMGVTRIRYNVAQT